MNTSDQKHTDIIKADHLKSAENHKRTAIHLETAAKHHNDAARLHEEGKPEKAAHSTIVAHGHTAMAHEIQKTDAKLHAVAAAAPAPTNHAAPIAPAQPIK